MKVYVLLLAVALLVVLAGTPVQSSAPAPAQDGGPPASQDSRPDGGNYRLSGAPGKVVFLSSGGSYRLQYGSPIAPKVLPDQGAGCCCTYLPCVPSQVP